jgi:hypothetical protein
MNGQNALPTFPFVDNVSCSPVMALDRWGLLEPIFCGCFRLFCGSVHDTLLPFPMTDATEKQEQHKEV